MQRAALQPVRDYASHGEAVTAGVLVRLLGFARVDTFLGVLVGDHRLVPHASCGCWSRVHLSLESSSNKQGSEDRFSFVLVLVSQGHVLLSSTPCRMDAFKGGICIRPNILP